jgi:uncharacterized protein
MPLFDLAPKDSARALYGRDAELATAVRLIREGRWTVLLGSRMVGKTSLAKAAVRGSGRPSVYVNLWGARGTAGLLDAFRNGLNASRPLLRRVARALARVEGLSIGPAGISLSPATKPLRTVWDLVNVIGTELDRSVIILDEVQELAAISGPLLRALANVFSSHPGVGFVFTGSQFGILRTLLEPPEDSPLFGRPPAEIRLQPFSRETSLGFLQRGFREYGRPFSSEQLQATVDRSLDGIPGWLTLFGNNVAVRRMSAEEAERATTREGKRVAASELAHFFSGRPPELYWAALRCLTSEASWSEVRTTLRSRRGPALNDNTVATVLRSLRSANLVVEEAHRYRIDDPMVRTFVRDNTRPPRARD